MLDSMPSLKSMTLKPGIAAFMLKLLGAPLHHHHRFAITAGPEALCQHAHVVRILVQLCFLERPVGRRKG